MSGVRLELCSDSPETTRRIAAALADVLVAGDVVALSGELGAGKTCFVQGAASGLGVADAVTSPTFVLVRTYAGRVTLVHADVYRLHTLQDVHDLGDEVLAPDAVTMLEWGDAVAALLPDDRLEVEILHDPDDEDARRLHLQAYGTSWTARATALEEATAAWR